MKREFDSEWERTIRLGRANQHIIELARRHCLKMTFVEASGRGLAEAQTRLPINMRQIRCPVAIGNGMAMNLEWIATDFYRDHCVNCTQRAPTGEVPNLATFVEQRALEAAEEAERNRSATAELHRAWLERAQRRKAATATATDVMAGAIEDIAVLDTEPGRDAEPSLRDAARRRLTVLADRNPHLFSEAVVGLAVSLITDARVVDLLEPLRHLARQQTAFAPQVLGAALATLRFGPDVNAGRCLADLRMHLDRNQLDSTIVRSLVILAGAPSEDHLGRLVRHNANDPTGLETVAELAPDLVVETMVAMLPPPATSSSIVVPSGTRPKPEPATDFERATAATAIRELSKTHPDVAARLVPALLLDLGVDAEDHYNIFPVTEVQRTLAAMLVLNVGDVAMEAAKVAQTFGSQLHEPLFGVFEQASRLLDPEYRFREPGDPQPEPSRRNAVFDQLVTFVLARLNGDWGEDVCRQAAEILATLADTNSKRLVENLPSLLGSFLALLDQLNSEPRPSLLMLNSDPPVLRTLSRGARLQQISSAANSVLKAVERVARENPLKVCDSVIDLMLNEREVERGKELRRRLLPLIGKIGRDHGQDSQVLQRVLPTLHSYLVDVDQGLRARAIDAWVEIARSHQLPSSLADLLPALIDDAYIVVISSVLRAGRRLQWPADHRRALFAHASGVLAGIDLKQFPEVFKEAVQTATALAPNERTRAEIERLILQRASELDAYDLRDVLDRREWLPEISRSPAMARLRLRQAADPRINDRFNARDDDELRAVLDCGSGLTAIELSDLMSAALSLPIEYPLACADFVEVAWRAGRIQEASEIAQAVLTRIPPEPAYDNARGFAHFIAAAVTLDAARPKSSDWRQAMEEAAAAVDALSSQNGEYAQSLLQQLKARATIRSLLSDDPIDARLALHSAAGRRQSQSDPVVAARRRAASLAAAGSALRGMSDRDTATGIYVQAFGQLCEAAAHLLRMEAAVLDADDASAAAHLRAARRRAEITASDLTTRFNGDDPLVGPLIAAFLEVRDTNFDTPTHSYFARWAAMSLPLLIVGGRQQRRRGRRGSPDDVTGGVSERSPLSVAVTLASIEGRLVTGPQVLRPNVVYELALQVQPGPWPDWAKYLDAEFLGHLTPTEVTLPTFTWQRDEHIGDGETFTKSGPLVLRFGLPAGRPAAPFLVSLRWRGSQNGEHRVEPLDTAGHRQLRLRPFDAARDFLTDYPEFDERLLVLYEKLSRAGFDDGHFQAFCRLLTAVSRVGLRLTWDKRYRRGTRVPERRFHDDLFEALLREPELGNRIERGSPLALGFLDVRHDSITAELKVERKNPVTATSAARYIGQPTQYAAADGARLSILSILDMSPKELPVGTPENYLFTLEPRLHGLDNPDAPSLVAVLVVNGNLPPPSAWSRRKTPVAARQDH